jgi:alanine racemase
VPEPAHATGTILTIDLDAVAANYGALREKAPEAECAAVVKADGYGLGAVPVVRALVGAGCETFFVAHLGEALAIRGTAPDATIAVLNGAAPGAEAELAEHGILPVLNSLEAVAAWTAQGVEDGTRLPAILHVDTGMSRLGLSDAELDRVADDPSLLDGIDIKWLMSHLAVSEEPKHPLNAEQRARFEAARARLPALPASLANSSGIFLGPDYHYDLVRPGAALYGVNPTPSAGTPPNNPMRPVVRLEAPILQVRSIDSPRTVGYGATHGVTGTARIATIPVGYADGYLRSLSNRGRAFLGDHEVPVVGRVSMDLVTLDVTAVPEADAHPGAMVEVISERHPVDAVAGDAGTIGYEILTSLGARYARRYSGAGA